MNTKILLVLGMLVIIFAVSTYIIFELPQNKINEDTNLSFNKNNSNNQNTSLPVETKEDSECKKLECPKIECPNAECPKCPEKIDEGKMIYIETRLNNTGNANLSDGRIKFYLKDLNNMIRVESSLNHTFAFNSSIHDKALIIYDVNYSCEKCKECSSCGCGSCYCSDCICPEHEKPDLSVANVTFIGNLTTIGETIEIITLVKNLGNVYIDYTKVEIVIDNFTDYMFVHLNANSEKNLSFNWIVTEGEHTLTVSIDPENVTNETNKTNNKLTKKITTCFVPYDDMYINVDTILCYGVYNIVDSGTSGVIIINKSNVVLDCGGATLNGSSYGYGIHLSGYDNITIKNCNLVDYTVGIKIYGSKGNGIFRNNISKNGDGIFMEGSHNTISNNNISLNGNGIYCWGGFLHNISNNEVAKNSNIGIQIRLSDNNSVTNNQIYSNRYGIYVYTHPPQYHQVQNLIKSIITP
ncbi:MAG: hypothetical protein GW779_00665 [Candidatus Altiarchaeum hamiconexum]|uniref:Right handed beta helix domain-containing protein n=1 Tax=Candidatus Altarchaeum hamiconexum TaxID=1803513 RepID=A0A8J7YYM0_9ARCH|nr:hypothetical protein [Candidatus Altarchaeum hamiconexum]OIQ04754.1 MAG: hypothetical protein AUK59_06510 [Candidatus Altarchaeum sp. CG2_30_32_3053]PIN67783.1 MAG: hypothetical protein COV98_01520 [Candidatus Altarchaeum sp. CG12_big_fil_rev_8_21_14_0_65_33_22]PIX48791.1 MAG: hypothetical protein COZ53_02920 [Candidatus Altarchaeum sp. CG_4_8_14_3_um_filter_33_2054]PIZ30970.1 MAG: hypothetical protein COY41_03175 [Candidatus Altarchaeum sp. CG_4_10_14_0_8_um_filter_32_851]